MDRRAYTPGKSKGGHKDLAAEAIILDGFGITASSLVPPGTVAIILHGGEVKVVAADRLHQPSTDWQVQSGRRLDGAL